MPGGPAPADPPPVCLVTGGSSGIGRATARRFAEAGYRVAICARGDARLLEARAEIASHAALGPSAIWAAQQNLARADRAAELVDQIVADWRRLDVLVNNAAAAVLAPTAAMSAQDFDAMIDLNIRAPFNVTKRAWQPMSAQQGGTVVNISSLAAVDPFPGFGVYGATKAWIEIWTRSLAAEGQGVGIRAFAVRAGAVETPMLRRLFPDFPGDQTLDPHEVADLVFRLSLPDCPFASGDAIPIHRQ